MSDLKDELNELSPWLRDMKMREEGRQIPEGYFARMEEEVFANLESIGARRKPALAPAPAMAWWQRLLQPRMALALGSVAALVAAGWWFWAGPTAVSRPEHIAAVQEVALTVEDVEAYVAENLQEFEPEQLAEQLPVVAVIEDPASPAAKPRKPAAPVELSPADLENLIDDLSEEELREIL